LGFWNFFILLLKRNKYYFSMRKICWIWYNFFLELFINLLGPRKNFSVPVCYSKIEIFCNQTSINFTTKQTSFHFRFYSVLSLSAWIFIILRPGWVAVLDYISANAIVSRSSFILTFLYIHSFIHSFVFLRPIPICTTNIRYFIFLFIPFRTLRLPEITWWIFLHVWFGFSFIHFIKFVGAPSLCIVLACFNSFCTSWASLMLSAVLHLYYCYCKLTFPTN